MEGLLKQNSLDAWVLAFRMKTLSAMMCPIFLGGAQAFRDGDFNSGLFLVTLITGLLLQVLANLVNDYGDFLRGADRNRLGPKRAMASGIIGEWHMQIGIALNIFFILLMGSYLSYIGGWLICVMGLLGLFCAVWYSFGVVPLAFLGISEVVVFFLFGFAPTLLTYYLQTFRFSFDALILGLIPGFLASALMLTNNLRDIKEDEHLGKKTLAVRLGSDKSYILIFLLVLLALFSLLLSIFLFDYHFILFILLWPFFLVFHKLFLARLNFLLLSIGQCLLLVGILLSLGIIYERLSDIAL